MLPLILYSSYTGCWYIIHKQHLSAKITQGHYEGHDATLEHSYFSVADFIFDHERIKDYKETNHTITIHNAVPCSLVEVLPIKQLVWIKLNNIPASTNREKSTFVKTISLYAFANSPEGIDLFSKF